MQKLFFESAWDKTIAPADRKTITQQFESTKENQEKPISYVPIKEARNHREDLLVMTLVHNFTDESLKFNNLSASYWEDNQKIAEHTFSFEGLTLEARTSMPWTFIFPKTTLSKEPSLTNGTLVVKKAE